ncbi:FkbM family methyltransferase [Phormidium sp. LEGE 05292]|uniref:FkbM family methyltransferase n=1 Tax=[Phormidium] sp. LEGE 05292 TaxID=767427 RepID=UPI001882FC39|nr:FkbM family methyltransferase [Phormidium sp. LEGE 05292]MBE9224579.1 FkbM family methyltransferase [Phormidium sp. LEGE 05292]
MRIKQELIKGFIKLNYYILGKNNTLFGLKYLLHILPIKYAAPINWLALAEIPLDSATELLYTYGSPREFPQTKIKVNPLCLHARFFVMSGYYEESLTQEILSKERKGLLVDIGANFGYYSVLWLQKEGTRVIAVEPVTEYVELLHENLKDYQSRYEIFPGCIGDRNGTALLDTFGDPTMLTKVVTDEHQEGVRRSEMLTLNSLLEKYNETRIDVLKIDAEGYDLKILESCKSLFAAKAIETVFWETANSPEETEMMQFLESLGYVKILSQGATGYQLIN